MRYDTPCYNTSCIYTVYSCHTIPFVKQKRYNTTSNLSYDIGKFSSYWVKSNSLQFPSGSYFGYTDPICKRDGYIYMITIYLIVSYAWFSTIEISFTLISFSGHTSLIGKEEGRKHVNGKVALLVISNSHQGELRVYVHTTGQMRKKYCLIVELDFLMMTLCNIRMRNNSEIL